MFSNDTFVVCLPGKYIPASSIRSGTSAIDFGTSTSFKSVDTDKEINYYYYNTLYEEMNDICIQFHKKVTRIKWSAR